jgi:class 3 adenylate cyclase
VVETGQDQWRSASLPSEFSGGRYQVKRLLGAGGSKIVYLARDTRLEREVAFALIKTDGLDDDGKTRVRREARAMGQLGEHPNVVNIYDIGEDAGRLYIVSQYVAGGSLEDLLKKAEGHRLPLKDSLRIADQICQALVHAHSHGIVHRDLKPGNLFIAGDGSLKLGDFGLALSVERTRLTGAGMMVGTAAYMAPEQALGGEPDPRCDLYALGAILYEMTCGRPPFLGDSAVAIISQHINTAPIAPSWHVPDIARDLEAVIVSLLAKVPEERPPSVSVVRERLAQISTAPIVQPEQSRTASAPAAGRLDWGRFIGRADEMAVLRAAIDASLGGQASLVMIAGEPGIGKTRLAEEAGVYARLRGAQLLMGRCYEGESASPYSSFVEAIRDYVSSRPDDALKAELGDGGSDVAKLVSEIRKRIPDLPPARATDPNDERMRLFDSVASFLINASKANPIMLLLDDLHWADKPSLLLLQHLARRFKSSRLIVVGTYRDVELDRRHPLSEALAELRRERLYERVLLRGLSETEVKDLIEAISQQEVPAGREEFVRAILRETEGNPFFVEETLRHLAETGSYYRREGRWVTDAKSISELGIPEGVRDVIGRRLSRLSETTNRVLAAAAVLGREFEFEVLTAMSELGEDAILSAVEEGLSARMVLESQGRGGPRYAFTHALVRQTLYEELSLPRRQRLHLKAAQAIEAAHQRNPEPYLAALANHYRMAGVAADAEKTIDYSFRAGKAAFAVFAYEEAGAHWRAALELMDEQGGGDRKRRADLLFLLGDEPVTSSGPKVVEYLEAAAALYEELGDTEGAIDVHTRLGLCLSAIHLGAMDMRRATDHFKKAEAYLAKKPDSLRYAVFYCGMVVTVGVNAMQIGDGLKASKRVMEIGGQLHIDILRSYGEILSSFFLVYSGSVAEGLRLADQARHRAEPVDDTMLGSLVAWFGGVIYQRLGDPRESQDWYTSELAKPRGARSAFRRKILQYLMVGTCIDVGELAKARSYLADLNAQNKPELPDYQGHLAQLLFIEGEWELACKTLTAWSECSRASGSRREDLNSAAALARLHMLTRERALALQFLQKALDISVEGGDILSELTTRSQLATIAADAGDPAEALPHLERCRQIVGAGENWRGLAGGVERAEAVLAAARGQFSGADGHFERAIANFQQYCRPWEEADTLQYWGRALLAANERTRAIEKFDAAIQIYRSRGAGTRFIEYVLADKMRAQGSKSSLADVEAPLTDSIHVVAAVVAREQPDLVGHAAPDGTVSILFTDIENSTAMFEKLGDLRAHEILHEHNAIVREQLAAHEGFEVKAMGDGFMLAFSSARRALLCAIAIQRALADRREKHPSEPIHVRIGLHTGEAIKEAGDFYGKTVILASRIAAEANGGEILVSSTLKEMVDNAGDLRFEKSRDVELQGLAGHHRIHKAQWYETQTDAVTGQTECIFRREGDFWTIAYEGKTARLKDAKGLHYIAHLLAHPGEEIRALDLVTRIGGGGEETVEKASAEDLARTGALTGDLGHAGEMLDAQAKAAYQRRLTELEEEVEEAREFKDEERIAKAEDEIEALGRELKGAIGLAGRDRRSASATERGRIAVTKAIRLSLNKIAENHASLGKLLSTTIKTGTVCAYVPDDRFPVSWRL